MSEELNRCPFCGGFAELLSKETYSSHTLFWVECIECDCRTSDYEDSKEEVIKRWNRRVAKWKINL